MIGKVLTGKSFGGCVRYVLGREEAEILAAEGIRLSCKEAMIADFNAQRMMKPEVGKAVGHIILSWSIHDAAKLNPALMAERAKEYMRKMKISNTQYLIVKHSDRDHPHLHLIYNRIDNEAKTISDRFQKKKNIAACRALTLKYGYYMAAGKTEVKRQRLTGADKVKYDLFDAIKSSAASSATWEDLIGKLNKQEIEVQFKFLSGTEKIQGISFWKNGLKFKGSEIDRSLSYGKLDQTLRQNASLSKKGRVDRASDTVQVFRNNSSDVKADITHNSLLHELLQSPVETDTENPFHKKKKRKNKQRRYL